MSLWNSDNDPSAKLAHVDGVHINNGDILEAHFEEQKKITGSARRREGRENELSFALKEGRTHGEV